MANLRPEGAQLIKKSKEEAKYRMSQACKSCDHYFASGVCEMVEGAISPNGACNYWETMERSEYRDREYFEKEYSKKQGMK